MSFKKFAPAVLSALAVLFFAMPAQAALTATQVDSIMGLLRAFGADQSVIANVQTSLTGTPASQLLSTCVDLSYSLHTGRTDATTNGSVTRLQRFLGVSPTGYFGPQTEQAVQSWQAVHSIVSSGSPDTTGYGLVGPQTMQAMRCKNEASTVVVTSPQPTNPSNDSKTNTETTPSMSPPVSASTVTTEASSGVASSISESQPPFIYGINITTSLDDATAKDIAAAHAAVRIPFAWDLFEHTKGQWTYGLYDAETQKAQEYHIPVLAVLHSSAQWAVLQDSSCTDRSWFTCQPQNVDDYLNYVATVVKRYPSIKYWEVWNEENLEQFWHNPSPVAYVALLKRTYDTIKQNNPNAVVVLGGVSLFDPPTQIKYIEGIYGAGGKSYFDVMNIHPYREPAGPNEKYSLNDASGQQGEALVQTVASVKQVMDQNGDNTKKIWVTEIGWQTAGGARVVTPAQQSLFMQQTFDDLKSLSYIGAVFWYELKDNCTDASDYACWLGIKTYSGTPKPAFVTFEHLQDTTAVAPTPPSTGQLPMTPTNGELQESAPGSPAFATIDKSALTTSSSNPTISGSAGNLPHGAVWVVIEYKDGTHQLGVPKVVTNGRWQASFTDANLQPGSYLVAVYPGGVPGTSENLLAVANLTIVKSPDTPAASATIDQNSLVTSSPNPTISGTASNLPYGSVWVVIAHQDGTNQQSLAGTVTNGRWQIAFNSANLQAGTYLVAVYPAGVSGTTENLLATGTLVVHS